MIAIVRVIFLIHLRPVLYFHFIIAMHPIRLFNFFAVNIFICLFSLKCIAQQEAKSFLYISLKGDNKVSVYEINPSDGQLNNIYDQPVSGGPASLALHPSKKFLYIARRNDKAVSAFSIDSVTGMLGFLNEISVVDNPVYIATDRKGNYLLTTYFGASKAAVYPVETTGRLSSQAVKSITTGANPHAILTDNSNRFLYISVMTGNKIEQFSFDSLSGSFTALIPAEVLPVAGTGPRHFVFHGTKNIVYFVNETGNSVSAYHIDNSTGLLQEFQTVSTLPPSFASASKCADIHLTPGNKFLYASNRGHESIAAYRVDEVTGALSIIDYYPTVATPREFDIDPSGNFLYTAGETSNNLACYKINEGNGTLDSLYTINTGNTPSWVLTVEYSGASASGVHSSHNTDQQENKAYVYPNPAGDGSCVVFYVNEPSDINISVFDISGRLIRNVKQTGLKPGYNKFNWNGCDNLNRPLTGGIYICRISYKKRSEIVNLYLNH
ncbi:MAG: beta-propeller fold lactonase family protein [Bacteroidales bacterium]|nr:beta-propeller fold lactonase family protein [Bacteroidales bacterium]